MSVRFKIEKYKLCHSRKSGNDKGAGMTDEDDYSSITFNI